MENKRYVLRFRAVDNNIWKSIKTGNKKVETRAATSRYQNIKAGDSIVFVCGKSKFTKRAKRVRNFRTVAALTRVYKPKHINPTCSTTKELEEMYFSFPGYREKIKKFGIIAIELT